MFIAVFVLKQGLTNGQVLSEVTFKKIETFGARLVHLNVPLVVLLELLHCDKH
jgi:hypothetical protein